jgi:hypothetical protein
MTLLDFLDLNNPEHVKALFHFDQNGHFPEGFVPDNIEYDILWFKKLYLRLGNKWVRSEYQKILDKETSEICPIEKSNVDYDIMKQMSCNWQRYSSYEY